MEAYRLAFACDPVSAYGSIIAANREVDLRPGGGDRRAVRRGAGCAGLHARGAGLAGRAQEELPGDAGARPAAADASGAALGARAACWRRRRIARGVDESTWQVVTQRQPTEAERRSLAFAWLAVKHVKSNAIVFVQGTATVGVGAGQMNRVDSVYLAARRAGDRAVGAVLGSDAFFPFPDGIEAAAAAGVTAVIQPGGSLRDEEAIAAADRLGMAMVFTGERHFRH